jgi:outer membrane protein TolC
LVIPRGVLGNDGSGEPIPLGNRRFDQGSPVLTYGQLQLTQPVTQLFRIRQADALAGAQLRSAEAQQRTTERDIALNVERLYLGVLMAREKMHAAQMALTARARQQVDADASLTAGTTLRAQSEGARATTLDAQYEVEEATNEADDLEVELRDLLGLPPGTTLDLVTPASDTGAMRPLSDYLQVAVASSPEVAAATADAEQARRARALARADYIPDIGVGVSYAYQQGVPFLPRNTGALTIQGSWTVWDFGKRGDVERERAAASQVASLALEHARNRVAIDVEKAYRKAERATTALVAARAGFDARRDALQIARDEAGRGIVPVAYRADAEATLAAAESQLIQAELGARLARAELAYAAGVSRAR